MKTYEVFLFDADGTLYDYDLAEANALRTVFEGFGLAYDENVRARYRAINADVWGRYERGEISKDELQTLRFARLFAECGVCCEIDEFNRKYLSELGKGAHLIDGAFDICEAIVSRGKSIYIVTNGILATQEARIKHSRIRDFVAGFFVSEFVGAQKPDSQYFEYVFSHIPPVGKDKILIVGDSLTADIAGGNNAGIDACWFNPSGNENCTNVKPTFEIQRLDELRKMI